MNESTLRIGGCNGLTNMIDRILNKIKGIENEVRELKHQCMRVREISQGFWETKLFDKKKLMISELKVYYFHKN